MCNFCYVFCQTLCPCLRNKKKGRESKAKKKTMDKSMKSQDRSSSKRKTDRIKESIGQGLYEDKDLFPVIELPIDGFTNPKDYMKSKNYELTDKLIGKGSYGYVYLANKLGPNDNKETIACKVLKVLSPEKYGRFKSLSTELKTLEKLDNDYIIKTRNSFVFLFKQRIETFIFMDYATEGNLEDQLEKVGPFDDRLAKRYFGQIVIGIRYLHKNSITHRDLKLENILLVKSPYNPGEKDCKITDFGTISVAFVEEKGYLTTSIYIGSRPYMAPEVLNAKLNRDSGKTEEIKFKLMPVDCWALGVIAYRLLTKEFPFDFSTPDKSEESKMRIIKEVFNKQINRDWSFPQNIVIDERAQELIRRCLDPNPVHRLENYQIIAHPWLEGEASLSITQSQSI